MPTFSAAYASASGPFNIFAVISGQQTTGVTKSTGVDVRPAISRNYSRLEIMVDSLVGGIIYLSSGPPASASNRVGAQLLSGETKLYDANKTNGVISLADKWFDLDTTGMVIHIAYE